MFVIDCWQAHSNLSGFEPFVSSWVFDGPFRVTFEAETSTKAKMSDDEFMMEGVSFYPRI